MRRLSVPSICGSTPPDRAQPLLGCSLGYKHIGRWLLSLRELPVHLGGSRFTSEACRTLSRSLSSHFKKKSIYLTVSGLSYSMQLSSLTRDGPGAPAFGAWCLSHWTSRKVPRVLTFKVRLLVYTTPEAPVKDLQSSVEVFELCQRIICNNCHWLHTYSVPGPRLSTRTSVLKPHSNPMR